MFLFFFAAFAHLALVALPLFFLTLASRPRRRNEILAAAVAAVFAFWWLLTAGPLPQQTLRAAAIIGAAAFTVAAGVSRWTTIHRSLAAISAATVGVAIGFALLKLSWREMHWTVQHQISSFLAGTIWPGSVPPTESPAIISTVTNQPGLGEAAHIMADYYPAIIALEMIVSFALVTALYHRISRTPWGLPLGRLRDFRFSEHLGWAAVIPLVILLLPKLAAIKLAASNVLVVASVLYAARGVAVMSFILSTFSGGFVLNALIWLAVLFMLPVMLAGALVLGVVDSRVDLRDRWTASRSNR